MRKVLLCILDGWGNSPRREGNAILLQGTPNIDKLAAQFPVTQLFTSGLAVGLPEGQMGNSEVGHTNLGAGRVVYQDLVRINRAIETGELFKDETLVAAMRAARSSALHLLGLVGDGGVHAQQTHLLALVELARREGVKKVFVHAFTDGRDTSPSSGKGFVAELEQFLARASSADGLRAQVATVIGRYWAMDRDKRWDRVGRALRAMVHGEGLQAASAVEAVAASYARNEGDEFLQPTVIVQGDNRPRGLLRDGDSAIFFNFRADRARELTQLLAFDDPPGWNPDRDGALAQVRGRRPRLSRYTTLTEYDATFTARGLPAAFSPDQPREILPELIASAKARQLHAAETEKYAHVTYFFNGGREEPFAGEERVLVPSPRDVKTYDLKPEMSAEEVTRSLEQRLGDFDFVLVNYANPDMVGHTGVLPAALKAVAKVDACVGRLWTAAQKAGMAMVVTADHGNIETMIDPVTGEPFTAHTLNPVPIYLCDPALRGHKLRQDGILADVAPTLLQMAGLRQPSPMTGKSLLAP
ncbi:MAG: 2,3-bisphosphoglycerate-independent phosphoglycerate mutase [Myxococcales bacterium]